MAQHSGQAAVAQPRLRLGGDERERGVLGREARQAAVARFDEGVAGAPDGGLVACGVDAGEGG